MSEIQTHDFDDHIQGSGLDPFELDLTFESGDPIDLTGATIIMQLVTSLGVMVWEFSNRDTANTQITGTDQGVVSFPTIKKWDIAPTKYSYVLKIIEASGFVRYALIGTWRIMPDPSKY